jgi:hypothetical protein
MNKKNRVKRNRQVVKTTTCNKKVKDRVNNIAQYATTTDACIKVILEVPQAK